MSEVPLALVERPRWRPLPHVCYDTEDDPDFHIKALDGFLVRMADLTPGHTLRSVLVDAFADELTTGAALRPCGRRQETELDSATG